MTLVIIIKVISIIVIILKKTLTNVHKTCLYLE